MRWIHAVLVVTFDQSLGPTLQYLYPEGALTAQEAKNACILSFPHSHTSQADDAEMTYTFRLNLDNSKMKKPMSQRSADPDADSKVAPSHKVYTDENRKDIEFMENSSSLFGYVRFRVRKDPNNPRGVSQDSIVILSALPCLNLFTAVTNLISTKYKQPSFDQVGDHDDADSHFKAVAAAGDEILSKWATPIPGTSQNMTLFDHVLTANVPLLISDRTLSKQKNRLRSKSIDAKTEDLSLTQLLSVFDEGECGWFRDIDLYTEFTGMHKTLWPLWELLITGSSLLVYSSSADITSRKVLCLASLVAPLIYHGDYRPYFTIYDSDFQQMVALHKKKELGTVILGVTNPFILKQFDKFPHTLYVQSKAQPPTNPNRNSNLSKKNKLAHDVYDKLSTKEKKMERAGKNELVSTSTSVLLPDKILLRQLSEERQVVKRVATVAEIAQQQAGSKKVNFGQKLLNLHIADHLTSRKITLASQESLLYHADNGASNSAIGDAATENCILLTVKRLFWIKDKEVVLNIQLSEMVRCDSKVPIGFSAQPTSQGFFSKLFGSTSNNMYITLVDGRTTVVEFKDQEVCCFFMMILSKQISALRTQAREASDNQEDIPTENIDALIKNSLVRKYFSKLTCDFLEPILSFYAQYKQIGSTNRLNPNPYCACTPPIKFSESNFLEYLQQNLPKTIQFKPTVQRKKAFLKLYTRFIRSPNFKPWLNGVREGARVELEKSFQTKMKIFMADCKARNIRSDVAIKMMLTSLSKPELEACLRSCQFFSAHFTFFDDEPPDPQRKNWRFTPAVLLEHMIMIQRAIALSI